MPRKPEPKTEDVIDAVKRLRRATVLSVAEITGCDYGPTRRVLERLDDEGKISKVMIGTRKFAFEPAAIKPDPELTEIAESYGAPRQAVEEIGDAFVAAVCPDDDQVWEIRAGGRRLGEIAEIRFGVAVKYQVISPFSPDVFDTFGEASNILRHGG